MNYESDIHKLNSKGFVILRASRANNAPIGWKRKISPSNKVKWGYVQEMADPLLSTYHSTFNAAILARSHCGFYLGHGNLCCIDLDVKKVDAQIAIDLKDSIVKKFGANVVVELTKSNGFHIYFLYEKREDNIPNWTGLDAKTKNWIELYYSKRFIACYLSNSKKYKLLHSSILDLKPLSTKQHTALLGLMSEFRGEEKAKKIRASNNSPVDRETWQQAEEYVRQLEERQLDITGDNPTWFKIGKGFVNAFGSKGFEMFNRLSQFSSTYNADTIETQYQSWCNNETPKDKRITIATFFKICADNGLNDLTTITTLRNNPPAKVSEFELVLTKKERMPEHVHTLVEAFLKHVEICCIDTAYFYVYETTHWVKRNSKQVVDLLNNFVDRSDVEDKYRKLLRTLPYLDMAIRELKLITQRDAIEPMTGNLHDGVFINLENGVLHINIKTGKRKLLDHESKYNFTTILPFCYEPAAECRKFDAWIGAQIPDATLHTAYYAFVASCLTKHKADIIMLLVGDTSTGKSSLIDITRRLIGLENSVAISAGILFGGTPEAQTQAMQMENKLLAYDFDSQPFKHLEMLLKVAAQEPLPGWQMHVTRRPIINYGRLLIAMNPYSYSVFNPAVARRLITVNMDVKIEKDNSVMPAIYEHELAGIFNHILNIGIRHLIENGGQIKITEKMRQATIDFHTRERDSVRWFKSLYLVPKPTTDKSNKRSIDEKMKLANPNTTVKYTSITQLYQEYRTWMMDNEGVPESKIQLRKHFAADLKLIGIYDDQVFRAGKAKEYGVFVALSF